MNRTRSVSAAVAVIAAALGLGGAFAPQAGAQALVPVAVTIQDALPPDKAPDTRSYGALYLSGVEVEGLAEISSYKAVITKNGRKVATRSVPGATGDGLVYLDGPGPLKVKVGKFKMTTRVTYRSFETQGGQWSGWQDRSPAQPSADGEVRCYRDSDVQGDFGWAWFVCQSLNNDTLRYRDSVIVAPYTEADLPRGEWRDIRWGKWVADRAPYISTLSGGTRVFRPTESVTKTKVWTVKNSSHMTRWEYNRIHKGSSYAKVKSIVGGGPESSSRTWKSGHNKYVIYYWPDDRVVKFKNGRVSAKSWS